MIAFHKHREDFRSGEFGELYETWIGSFGIEPSPLLLAMYQVQALSE